MPDPVLPLLSELLAHQEFVRRLAQHLVVDPDRADDVTQDVWLRALEHPPRERGSLTGWLARVTRNLASNASRNQRVRHDHESRAARTESDDPVGRAERELALQHRVVEAVQSLDEPYRAPILLRYFKELSHAQISTELGLPIATVRARLQRSLAKLRECLDRTHSSREEWLRGLTVLLGKDFLPSAVSAGGSTLGGGLLMGIAGKSIASILILGGVAWWLWKPAEERAEPVNAGIVDASPIAPPVSEETESGTDGSPVPESRAEIADAAATDVEEEADPPQPTIERGWVVLGRVRGLDEHDPERARIRITGINDYSWPEELVAEGEAGSDGRFEVDVSGLVLYEGGVRTPLHFLVVGVDHPLRQHQEARLAVEARHSPMAELEELDGPIAWWVEIDLRPAGAIAGRVIHADGTPAAGATVGAWPVETEGAAPKTQLGDSARCDDSGVFLVRVVTPGDHAVCAVEDDLRPATQIVTAKLGERVDAGSPFVLDDGAHIEGRVLRLGEPLADATASIELVARGDGYSLRALPRGSYSALTWVDGRMERASAHASTDAEGRFAIHGLMPGEHRVRPGQAPDYRIGLGGYGPPELIVAAPASGVDLALWHAAVRILSREELPKDGNGLLTIRREGYDDYSCDFRGHHGIPSFTGTPGEQLAIEVRFEGKASWRETLVMPRSGEELVREIELEDAGEPAVLELAFEAPAGVAVTEVSLGFCEPETTSDRPMFDAVATSTDGVARFEGLHPGRYRVTVRADKWFHHYRTYCIDQVLDLELFSGRTERREITLELGGRIEILARDDRGQILPAKVELRDASGLKLETDFVARSGGGWGSSYWQLSSVAPSETFPNRLPGDYLVYLELDGHRPQTIPVTVVAGSTQRVYVVLDRE